MKFHILLRFGRAFMDHCRISKGLSEHTLRAYRQDKAELEHFCAVKYLAREDLKRLVIDYLEYLKESRNLKPRTVKRWITCLKTFFKWLERNEMITSSPFHKLDISIRLPKQLPRSLSLSEMQRLERHARPGPARSFNPSRDVTAAPDDPANPKMTT